MDTNDEVDTKKIRNHIVWKTTTLNDGSGFCPNVTVTSIANMYYVFAAKFEFFPDKRILIFFVSEFKNQE